MHLPLETPLKLMPPNPLLLILVLAVAGCGNSGTSPVVPVAPAATSGPAAGSTAGSPLTSLDGGAAAEEDAAAEGMGRAIFAAGCFWCVEQAFDGVDGVVSTVSGYTGGSVPAPSYRQVTAGNTGHYEALEVRFDPARVSYEDLLAVFWRNVDPTDEDGQFCDRGSSYRGAIFALDDAQRRAAQASKEALMADPDAPGPIVTPVVDAAPFYDAEDYHQDYYLKNPLRYRYYKTSCGRAARLEELWGPA